jgi:hypothetical protein
VKALAERQGSCAREERDESDYETATVQTPTALGRDVLKTKNRVRRREQTACGVSTATHRLGRRPAHWQRESAEADERTSTVVKVDVDEQGAVVHTVLSC